MGAVGGCVPLVRGCAVRRGAGRRAVSAVHVVVGALYCGVTYLLGAKKASFGRVRPLPCHEIHQVMVRDGRVPVVFALPICAGHLAVFSTTCTGEFRAAVNAHASNASMSVACRLCLNRNPYLNKINLF